MILKITGIVFITLTVVLTVCTIVSITRLFMRKGVYGRQLLSFENTFGRDTPATRNYRNFMLWNVIAAYGIGYGLLGMATSAIMFYSN